MIDMRCYEDLIQKIREKDIPETETDSLMKWAFDALERSDSRTYKEIINKMENMAYSISPTQAETIVKSMRPRGQVWTMDQIKEYVTAKGIHDDYCDWYLVMNMCYNDYYGTAKMYGLQNETDFYFNLAKDFIEDPDAEPHKVAKYFS